MDDAAARVRRLAQDLLPRAPELAAAVTEAVLAEVPDVAPTRAPEQLAVLRESTDQNVGAILATLAFGVHAAAIEPPVGTLALFPQIVDGGGDITTLLHAYRVGHANLWRAWSEHVAEKVDDAAELSEVLALSSAHMFAYINSACERLVADYRAHYAPDGDPGSSRDHVLALLGTADVDLDAVRSRLRYDVRDHHVALVVTPVRTGANVRAGIDAIAEAAGGSAVLAHPAGDGSWWAWLGRRTAFGPEDMATLCALPPDGVLIGLGEPGQGRSGFRRSHAQAREAERTTRLSGAPAAGVVRHRDVELAALLCADPDHARRFATDRLGPLSARDEATGRLRETLRTYLASGCSTARTAEVLHVHQKTVAYRLARCTELLGRPLGQANGEVEAALLIDLTLHGA